jgi:hypothetical protein
MQRYQTYATQTALESPGQTLLQGVLCDIQNAKLSGDAV